MDEYTRENVQEACQLVLEASGVERRVSNMLLSEGLPNLCNFAAREHFTWGDYAVSGPLLSALLLVRKALRAFSRSGEFGFDEEKAKVPGPASEE